MPSTTPVRWAARAHPRGALGHGLPAEQGLRRPAGRSRERERRRHLDRPHDPHSLASSSDPSIAAGSDGTIYEGWSDGTGRALVAVSRDHGKTWTTPIDTGGPAKLRNSEFAEVTAGDGDRAALAYLGTATKGTTQPATFGKSTDGKTFVGGEWHLYVATTYDRGRTWTTVDATPTDPVQRGCIWNSGGSNPCRNLLDVNDITVTKSGRVMVGRLTAASTPPSRPATTA